MTGIFPLKIFKQEMLFYVWRFSARFDGTKANPHTFISRMICAKEGDSVIASGRTYKLIILMAINYFLIDAGWSSLVARRAHNPKVVGSNPAPATIFIYFNSFSSLNLFQILYI